MSLFSREKNPSSQATLVAPPTRSRLFTELLDTNHDAWMVSREGGKFTFYREVGNGRAHVPFGSIVLTTGPGISQTLDFYSAKGKRSLLASYGHEVATAAQCLMDREYAISLFNGLAHTLRCQDWDHKLSFMGTEVSERRAELRAGTPAFQRLVGSVQWGAPPESTVFLKNLAYKHRCVLAVSQFDHHSPLIECRSTYPRMIEATFFSTRLTSGLDVITNPMATLVVEHNRNLERRYGEFGGDEW